MRRVVALAAPILVAAPLLASDRLVMTAATPDLAFGPLDVVAAVPAQKTASLVVTSAAPWMMTVTAMSGSDPLEMPTSAETIEVKIPGEAWTRVVMGIPVAVASGEGTNPAGAIVRVDSRVKADITAPPGARSLTLRFALRGIDAVAGVNLRYEVPAVTDLDLDPRPFDSPALDPARPGLYPYDRHHYIVHSNVPWAVDLRVGAPRSVTNAKALPPRALVFVNASGEVVPLHPGEPLMVASGEPTSRDGQPVDVELAIRIDQDALAGGDYIADIHVDARARSLKGR